MFTSLVSALCLLVVMLALGPLFQPLPVCVLAAIILASLVNILKKVIDKRNTINNPIEYSSVMCMCVLIDYNPSIPKKGKIIFFF